MKASFTITAAILLLLIVGVPSLSASDKLTLRGNFKDKNGESIPRVTVIVKDVADNPIAFAIGDNAGGFSLEYTPTTAGNDSIVFSAIGYRRITLPVGKFRSGSTTVMEEEALKLKEVTVKLPPIRSYGDTLTYNVASFRSASDRTIEDIIKKLPGITVSTEGRISYNGETINKFYIEGLDLLAGRYTLASRNISPDDVVAVNIYENHQPKRVLKDVEFSKYAALNLKLRKKSMLKPVGNIQGGAGADVDGHALWLGEAFTMLISPKSQMMVTLKGNNSGSSYVGETRSMTESELTGTATAYDIYPLTPFGSAKIPSFRYYRNKSFSASVNSIAKFSEFTTLNATADYTDENNSYSNSESITYATGTDSDITIREDAINNPHQREAKFGLKLEHNANSRYISDRLSFVGHFNSNRYDVANQQAFMQRVTTRDFNIRNTFNGTFRIAGSMVDFRSDTQFGTTPYNRLSALCDGSPIIAQTVSGYSLRNMETFGYKWFIDSKSHLGLDNRLDLVFDRFRSENTLVPTPTPSNNVNGRDITYTITPAYQNRFSERLLFNLSVPLVCNWLDFKQQTSDDNHAINRFDYNFRSSLRYTTPSRVSTTITIGRQNSLGGLTDYITAPVYVTFRSRNIPGSGILRRRTSHYATLSISGRNAYHAIFSSASLSYRFNTSNRLGSLTISEGNNIVSAARNIDNKGNQLSANLSFSKKVYSWHTVFSFDGNYELLSNDIIRQNNVLRMKFHSLMGHLLISSAPLSNWLDISLDATHNYTLQKITLSPAATDSHSTTVRLKLTSMPIKQILLSASASYSRSDILTDKSKECFFVDCGATYHLNRRIDIELAARNLANSRSYGYTYLRNSDIYSYSFTLRPAEATISVKYTL